MVQSHPDLHVKPDLFFLFFWSLGVETSCEHNADTLSPHKIDQMCQETQNNSNHFRCSSVREGLGAWSSYVLYLQFNFVHASHSLDCTREHHGS